MPEKLLVRHIVESIFIGIVTAMIMMAFFMPYFYMHHQLNHEINDVLKAYNPMAEPINEIIMKEDNLRVILFNNVREMAGTLFSPSLLLNNLYSEEPIMFFSSIDYFLTKNVHDPQVDIMGLNGTYAGFYPKDHPYGDNFLVIVAENIDPLVFDGELNLLYMNDTFRTNILPSGFRGAKLWSFLVFAGFMFLIFGITEFLKGTSLNFFKDNMLRLSIVSLTAIISLLIYGTLINSYDYTTIAYSCGMAIIANLFATIPLAFLWFGKFVYKKV